MTIPMASSRPPLQPGEATRRGPITKAGHSRTGWLLIQAAITMPRRRPPAAEALWTWALRIAARRGKHVAVVALARRRAGFSDEREYKADGTSRDQRPLPIGREKAASTWRETPRLT